MSHYLGYRCSLCKTELPPMEIVYNCPKCGGNLDVVLDYERINRSFILMTSSPELKTRSGVTNLCCR